MDILLLVIGCFAPTLIVAWAVGWLVRRWAPRLGLVDKPDARKNHSTPTPMGGGIAIWFAVSVFIVGTVIIAYAAQASEASVNWLPAIAIKHLPGVTTKLGPLLALVGGATAMMALGLADDIRGVDWRIRLGVEFGVAAACVLSQGEDWQLTAFMPIPQLAWIVSVFWIVVLINAFNMLDNMDAASAGIAALAGGILAAYVLMPATGSAEPQLLVGGFLCVLCGALVGFLIHNRPPARLFMGDAGSYFVGFCLAGGTLLATYTTYDAGVRHAVLAPLCVMAVPLYDMFTVIQIRLKEGRSVFQADRCHFSHRLTDLGMTRPQAVLTLYLTTGTCGLGALLLPRVDTIGAYIVLLVVACILLLIHILEMTARRTLTEPPQR